MKTVCRNCGKEWTMRSFVACEYCGSSISTVVYDRDGEKSLGQIAYEKYCTKVDEGMKPWRDMNADQKATWETVACEVVGQQMARTMNEARLKAFKLAMTGHQKPPSKAEQDIIEHEGRIRNLEEWKQSLQKNLVAAGKCG